MCKRGFSPDFRISFFVRPCMGLHFLFSDAEPAENAVENVVGHDGADDGPELIHGDAQVECDEFIATALEDDL